MNASSNIVSGYIVLIHLQATRVLGLDSNDEASYYIDCLRGHEFFFCSQTSFLARLENE